MSEVRVPSAFVLREATADDVPAIVRVINRAYVAEAFIVIGERVSEQDVRGMMGAPGRAILVAEEARDRAASMLGAVCVDAHGERGHFGPLAVDPDAQGRGLGRALVRAAEGWARERGCTRMELDVVSARTELPPFYWSLGYETTGRMPFPAPGRLKAETDLIVMARTLAEG